MKSEQEMVRQFHLAFAHPVASAPVMLDPSRVANRTNWLQEEINEFRHAETLQDQADAIVDLVYFALGTLVEMGVEGAPLFRIVHEANMKKLWPDGKPHFGQDGKVKKPPTWTDPSEALSQEISRQLSTLSMAS